MAGVLVAAGGVTVVVATAYAAQKLAGGCPASRVISGVLSGRGFRPGDSVMVTAEVDSHRPGGPTGPMTMQPIAITAASGDGSFALCIPSRDPVLAQQAATNGGVMNVELSAVDMANRGLGTWSMSLQTSPDGALSRAEQHLHDRIDIPMHVGRPRPGS